MMNRYKKGELVIVNGKGKINEENNSNVIGIIKEKDYYFNQYFVEILFGKDDWFKEKQLTRIFEKEQKKASKYKVCLAIRKDGFDYIQKQMQKEDDKTIDLFKQADLFQEYHENESCYFFIFWKDTYWPETNFTVRAVEEALPKLKKNNIPYQYIVISNNEKNIKINEFVKNDKNINIFEVLINIKINKIGGIL